MKESKYLQHWMVPTLHWLDPPEFPPVRSTTAAAERAGRMRNKKVKTVATRANMFNEAEWCFGMLEKLLS